MTSTARSTVLLFAAALFLVGGCAESRTYQVSVRNETAGPVTLWLFKNGGPYEDGWKSPEDIAIESPKDNEPIGGVVVPPQKTATAGPLKGQFNSDAQAILRVYVGSHTFNQLLAIGQNSGERKDVPLPQGASRFVVSDVDAKLNVDRVRGPLPSNP